MATIYDIAQKAGVSVATVSRVINGVNHPVREETRQRILDIAREVNYRPNTIARSLAAGKSHTIALLIPSITNNFYTQIAENIEETLGEQGYNTYLCNTKRSVEKETRYVDSVINRRVDGVIFCPTRVKPEDNEINQRNIQELVKHNIALVAFGSRFAHASQVYVNTYKGALDAVRYLITLGHRRIGFIDGLSAGTQKKRLRGYMEGLHEAGISVNKALIVAGNLEMDSGFDCASRLLDLADRPTALIVANNLMAVGAVKAAKQMGVAVPDDLSVVGFDDSLLSEVMEPSLTVVKQPLKEIGDTAAWLLMNQLLSLSRSLETVEISPELVIRESCRQYREG